jgi:hypothetical protein
MIIYWADSREPLTHEQRQNARGLVELVDITPGEVLLLLMTNGRKVVVRDEGDPRAPVAPVPDAGPALEKLELPTRLAARTDYLVERVGEGLLLMDEGTDTIHRLDPESARIWRLCAGIRSLEELMAQLEPGKRGVNPAECRRAVLRMLSKGILVKV